MTLFLDFYRMARRKVYTKRLGDELAVLLNEWTRCLVESKDQSVRLDHLFIEPFYFKNEINVRRQSDIEERSLDFKDALDQFREMQRYSLQLHGLKDKINARITTLMLSHYHKVNNKPANENDLSGQLSAIEMLMDEDDNAED